MKRRSGTLLAISNDEIEEARALVDELALPFRVLSAAGIPVLADYGLEHVDGGPEGETIAVPAELLLARDGHVIWKHVARRIPERADPEQILRALEGLPGAGAPRPAPESSPPR